MSNIKRVNLDSKKEKRKRKIILFQNFQNLKGASFLYRLKSLKWDIQEMFQRAVYGFDESAVYNLDSHFIQTYLEILPRFKSGGSFPGDLDPDEWDGVIQKLIDYLEIMKEDEFDYTKELPNGDYDWDTLKAFVHKKEKAKTDFFELFSMYFFDLWI